jgi:hypothetical protein
LNVELTLRCAQGFPQATIESPAFSCPSRRPRRARSEIKGGRAFLPNSEADGRHCPRAVGVFRKRTRQRSPTPRYPPQHQNSRSSATIGMSSPGGFGGRLDPGAGRSKSAGTGVLPFQTRAPIRRGAERCVPRAGGRALSCRPLGSHRGLVGGAPTCRTVSPHRSKPRRRPRSASKSVAFPGSLSGVK